jgi:hypothetical protein
VAPPLKAWTLAWRRWSVPSARRAPGSAVADFFTRYSVDALGGAAAHVSAYSAISFLAGEFSSLFAFPGGNHHLVERTLTALRATLRALNARPRAAFALGDGPGTV